MTDEHDRPIRITDRRRARSGRAQEADAAESPSGVLRSDSPREAAPSGAASLRNSPDAAATSSPQPRKPEEQAVVAPDAHDVAGGSLSAAEREKEPMGPEGAVVEGDGVEGWQDQVQLDYLEDLRRLQAEFDNYRKRVMREQTQLSQRASARLVERLLPILDNFESALAHGEGGAGIEMVYRELKKLLEDEGLQEMDVEGKPFDPTQHEAFQAVEDASVEEPTVRSVLRRGYVLKGQVLRPAMVSVARPPEESDEQDAAEG